MPDIRLQALSPTANLSISFLPLWEESIQEGLGRCASGFLVCKEPERTLLQEGACIELSGLEHQMIKTPLHLFRLDPFNHFGEIIGPIVCRLIGFLN